LAEVDRSKRPAVGVRWLYGPIATALLSVCLAACGEAGKGTSSTPKVPTSAIARGAPSTVSGEAPALRNLRGDEDDDDTPNNRARDNRNDNDSDFDNDSKASEGTGYYDGDDTGARTYGRAANKGESETIGALVKRYYAAAAAGNGPRACSLIDSLFARSIPEDYGKGAGPAYARGNTCAVVMSKLFEHDHSKLPAAIVVTGIRVNGSQARALIGSKTVPAGYLPLKRERGVWKVDALSVLPMP
jgi:hypothetical protein